MDHAHVRDGVKGAVKARAAEQLSMAADKGAINFQNVAEVFERMDMDQSGSITLAELEEEVVRQGYSVRVANLLMQELDVNKDGVLTYEELQSGLANSSFVPAHTKSESNAWAGAALVVAYFVFGAYAYGQLEGWDALDSAYFLMVTSTTVGYGDFCPETRMGKLFTCGYALVGMTLVISSLAPVVDFLSESIERVEASVTALLERLKLIPPAVNTLDMSLTVAQVNATINYTRRYILALNNLFVFLLIGLLFATVVVDSSDPVDYLYWTMISMTTVGYGDYSPTTPLGKILVMIYLPLSVAALAQSLSDVQAISLRRSIRETDYGAELAGEFLKAECFKHDGDPDESVTEGEFLMYVLIRRGLVDEQTIAAVRRQFRELVRHGPNENEPLEERVFDCRMYYDEQIKRGRIKQRPSHLPPGSREGGKTALVDLRVFDHGFDEWRTYHWEPLIAAGQPPGSERTRAKFFGFGGRTPLGLLTGMMRGMKIF